MRAHCAAVAAMAALAAPAAALVGSAAIEGRVLAPGSDGEGWWDQRTSAMPIVLPPSAHRKRWRMFYYGREDGNWNGGRPAFLPTGVSGLAESDDGLRWTRVRGPLEGGAVLRPPDDLRLDALRAPLQEALRQACWHRDDPHLGGQPRVKL